MTARGYLRDRTERQVGFSKRRTLFRMEAEALGNPARRLTGDDSEKRPDEGRIMHGRLIQPGVRPLLRMRSNAFLDKIGTERQQRRRRVRIARSWGRMLDGMAKTAMTMEQFVETLSPEELVRGRLKDKNGSFSGRPPAWVPAEFHRACIRELMRRGKDLWQINYLEAIKAMTKVASGQVKGASVADRLKAAQFVVERIEGKQPDTVLITEDQPWQVIIEDIVAQVPDEMIEAAKKARADLEGYDPGYDESQVMDAEIVEEEVVEEPKPSPRRRSAARRRTR